MKSILQHVTVSRWARDGEGTATRRARTWKDATEILRARAFDPQTDPRGPIGIRARWTNGLVLHEVHYSLGEARGITDLAHTLYEEILAAYGLPEKRYLTSSKAAMARQVLERCSFKDGEGRDHALDARVLDAATRALAQYFPDEAEVYVERIRDWMTNGGGVT